jgi:hypothetical protein
MEWLRTDLVYGNTHEDLRSPWRREVGEGSPKSDPCAGLDEPGAPSVEAVVFAAIVSLHTSTLLCQPVQLVLVDNI